MGACLSFRRDPEEIEMALPSPDRFDLPIPQWCFEIGSSSKAPEDEEDVKHVLPESVVLRSDNAVIPVVEPVVPPRVEPSRYAQGYYNNDYTIDTSP